MDTNVTVRLVSPERNVTSTLTIVSAPRAKMAASAETLSLVIRAIARKDSLDSTAK